MKRRLAKNAFANLCRGGAAAVAAMLLPPILIRHMAPASYAAWVLALQAAAYVSYLDFGLQTAVGRFVAYTTEKNELEKRDGIFSAAIIGLSIAALLGILVVLGIAIFAHNLFPQVPATILPSLRIAMVIAGISMSLGLPASAWSGIAAGIERYEIPAIAVGSGRLLSAAALIAAALTGQSIVVMACIVLAARIYSFVLQFALVRRAISNVRFRLAAISRSVVRELFGYCVSLTAWSASMLLVGGIDVLLVGRFDFPGVTPYSICSTLIAFIAGIQTAIFGVIMPRAATLHARENPEELGRLLSKSTQMGALLLLFTGLPLVAFASPIVGRWIGQQFAHLGGLILIILVIANMIRLVNVPYASILVGTGQQKLVVLTPVIEGITNLAFSIGLGLKYGAIGVAYGTLIGAIAGSVANVAYNIKKTKAVISLSRWSFLGASFALPLLGAISAFAVIVILHMEGFGKPLISALSMATFLLTSLAVAAKSKDFELPPIITARSQSFFTGEVRFDPHKNAHESKPEE